MVRDFFLPLEYYQNCCLAGVSGLILGVVWFGGIVLLRLVALPLAFVLFLASRQGTENGIFPVAVVAVNAEQNINHRVDVENTTILVGSQPIQRQPSCHHPKPSRRVPRLSPKTGLVDNATNNVHLGQVQRAANLFVSIRRQVHQVSWVKDGGEAGGVGAGCPFVRVGSQQSVAEWCLVVVAANEVQADGPSVVSSLGQAEPFDSTPRLLDLCHKTTQRLPAHPIRWRRRNRGSEGSGSRGGDSSWWCSGRGLDCCCGSWCGGWYGWYACCGWHCCCWCWSCRLCFCRRCCRQGAVTKVNGQLQAACGVTGVLQPLLTFGKNSFVCLVCFGRHPCPKLGLLHSRRLLDTVPSPLLLGSLASGPVRSR
eukprot:m.23017 g.23017  ORF g.23017 m.23017 type:complete len:367 (-) comp7027_c0_seq1:82-1182(-)